jgi:hypothetical protein
MKGARAKQAYAVAMKDGSPFGLAGLWENWRNPSTGEWERTFVIITVCHPTSWFGGSIIACQRSLSPADTSAGWVLILIRTICSSHIPLRDEGIARRGCPTRPLQRSEPSHASMARS